jgi:uncharacterized protein YdeI (YjbR/CyaY-like superfamily)
MADALPILPFPSAAAWEAWLDEHHAEAGVWLKFAKKGSGIATVTYEEAVQVALCLGWIDGQVRRFDERFYVQRFTPRRRASRWSKINVERATALIAAGRMRPAGQAQIDAAQADGRWEAAYESPSNATVPPDLQAALDANPAAATFFATLTGNARYAILYRVGDTKRPETRARRIAEFVQMLARGEKLH